MTEISTTVFLISGAYYANLFLFCFVNGVCVMLENFSTVPLGVRFMVVFLLSTALLGQFFSGLCLSFDSLLDGELRRLLTFQFVVAPGIIGAFHFVLIMLLLVTVGGVIERRNGTLPFLSEIAWLMVLVVVGVILFVAFSALSGFLMLLAVPSLPAMLQEVTPPQWHPCPSGFSTVIVALAIAELFNTWVAVFDHMLPSFVLPVLVSLAIAPFSLSSLLLHEFGWLAGFMLVFLKSRFIYSPFLMRFRGLRLFLHNFRALLNIRQFRQIRLRISIHYGSCCVFLSCQ
jgi:hypothetical protein